MTCWVGVASRDHVMRAVQGSFCQVNHGKATPLTRMKRGNRILYYSPREEMHGGDPVQAFTAIGRIDDDTPYQVRDSSKFEPFRRGRLFQGTRRVDQAAGERFGADQEQDILGHRVPPGLIHGH